MTVIKYEGVALCPVGLFLRLINLVEQYPEFLSWCKEVTVHSRGQTKIEATAKIRKYGISFHCPFTYVLRSNNEISVGLPSGGLFNSVSGSWHIQASGAGSKFSFELRLNYQKTWWAHFFLVPILKNEVKNLIKAFEQRALVIQS